MKKFLFLAIAATAFASCSQDEVMEVAEKQAITFGKAFVGNATRAIDPSKNNSTNLLTQFTAYGNLKVGETYVKLYGGDGVAATGTTYGTAYTTTETEYWTPNVTYQFAAVANANDVTEDETTGLPSSIDFEYTDGTVDLLYTKQINTVKTDASATPGNTGNYDVNDNGIVNFTFDHLLSKLQFKFINGSLDSRNIFKVKDIKISGLPASGTYTVATTPTWSTEGTTSSAVEFGDASDATETTADAVEILNDNTNGITSDKAMLVIPNKNTLTITFVKELYYDADNDDVADDDEMVYSDANLTTVDKFTTITLNGTGVNAVQKEFEANGNYVLVVTLGEDNEIKFTVETINGWTPEAGTDVNI